MTRSRAARGRDPRLQLPHTEEHRGHCCPACLEPTSRPHFQLQDTLLVGYMRVSWPPPTPAPRWQVPRLVWQLVAMLSLRPCLYPHHVLSPQVCPVGAFDITASVERERITPGCSLVTNQPGNLGQNHQNNHNQSGFKP